MCQLAVALLGGLTTFTAVLLESIHVIHATDGCNHTTKNTGRILTTMKKELVPTKITRRRPIRRSSTGSDIAMGDTSPAIFKQPSEEEMRESMGDDEYYARQKNSFEKESEAAQPMELEHAYSHHHEEQRRQQKFNIIASFLVLLIVMLGLAIYNKSNQHTIADKYESGAHSRPGSNTDEMTSDHDDGTDGSTFNEKPILEGPRQIYLYGDSLTLGWIDGKGEPSPYADSLRERLNTLFTEETIISHSGYPGMTAESMLGHVEDPRNGACRIIDKHPHLSLFVILTGTNDVMTMTQTGSAVYGKILSDIVHLHTDVLQCTHDNEYMHTVAISIPGSEYELHVREALRAVQYINEGLKRFAQSNPKVNYIDFPIRYDGESSLWAEDGIHLSASGYKELGQKLAPEIKKVLDNIYA